MVAIACIVRVNARFAFNFESTALIRPVAVDSNDVLLDWATVERHCAAANADPRRPTAMMSAPIRTTWLRRGSRERSAAPRGAASAPFVSEPGFCA
jgi:hypothetical protein